MSDQPRTEDKDTTIKNKEQPQNLAADEAAADDAYGKTGAELHGNGAEDRYSNDAPDKIQGEDREKFGIKQPDAMGAGG